VTAARARNRVLHAPRPVTVRRAEQPASRGADRHPARTKRPRCPLYTSRAPGELLGAARPSEASGVRFHQALRRGSALLGATPSALWPEEGERTAPLV
jgi:hypothetical protein